MKSSYKILISVLALGLAAAPWVRAADDTVSVPAPATPPDDNADAPAKKGGPGGRMRDMAVRRDKMLIDKLKLTDDQQKKLADIRKSEADAMKDAQGDRSKMRDLMKSSHDQVRAMLTPDQQKDFDQMQPPGGGRRGGRNKDGAPPAATPPAAQDAPPPAAPAPAN